MNREVLLVQPDETLDVALEQLTSHRIGWMPVVEIEAAGGRKVLGRISALDITRAYRETLARGSRRMRGMVEGTVLVEAIVEPGMPLAGRPLREAKLPSECLVVSIRREMQMLFPRGSTIIEAGDVVTFLVSPSGEERLHAYLAQRVEQAQPVLLD
jgi:Trk K+ transport system NAD-binding subunit